jgi:FKBP-type peptidyl-prolyl cis-trans isomerase FkpA
MKRLLLACLVLTSACAKSGGGSGARPEITTDEQKTFYALGFLIARNVATFNLSPNELEVVKAGLTDAVTGQKALVEIETWGPKVNQLANTRRAARTEAEKAKSKKFLEDAAKESGVTKTDSGLIFKTVTAGTGDSPKATDRVKVNYEGKLIDGTVFDSSIKRGQPAEFSLSGVVPCWTEGVQKMKVGEKAQLICPSTIAYGDRGMPPTIPGGAALIFQIELLEIVKTPPPPPFSMSNAPNIHMMPPGTPPPPGAKPGAPVGGKPATPPPPPSKK